MADIVRFTCPKCGQRYRAPSRLAGRKRLCVKCAAPFNIPSESTVSVKVPEHAHAAVASHHSEADTAERIPPAGPVSEFAASLAQSQAAHDAESAAQQFTAQPASPAVEEQPCPFCGEDIALNAVTCPRCGKALNGDTSEPVEESVVPQPQAGPDIEEVLSKAELAAADAHARVSQAASDARAKASEAAAVAHRNEERRAAIHRQIEMQAESDYRQILLRAADSLTAAEKAAISQCRYYSDLYHAVERMGADPAEAMDHINNRPADKNRPAEDTLSVMTHVMDLIGNPPVRFQRAHEKTVEAFGAYTQLEALSRTPSPNMAAREAALANFHNKFTTSMGEMRALIRTTEG